MATNSKTKIMVFGTFDILHKGHFDFFKQARRLARNPYLIVSVARDSNVKKIKGQNPLHSAKQRLSAVKLCEKVDKVVLGGVNNYLKHILKEQPQIIALGYDQSAYTKGLKKALAKQRLVVRIKRLKAYYPNRYKTSLLKKV